MTGVTLKVRGLAGTRVKTVSRLRFRPPASVSGAGEPCDVQPEPIHRNGLIPPAIASACSGALDPRSCGPRENDAIDDVLGIPSHTSQ